MSWRRTFLLQFPAPEIAQLLRVHRDALVFSVARPPVTVLILLALLGAQGLAQSGPTEASERIVDPPAFLAAFLKRFEGLENGDDAAADPQLVRLVKTYPTYAIVVGCKWLDGLGPNAKTQDTADRATSFRRVNTIAKIMAAECQAPGFGTVVKRVMEWSASEWTSYAEARQAYARAKAHEVKHDHRTAAANYMRAARGFHPLGHIKGTASALFARARCLFELGEVRGALSMTEKALPLFQKMGDTHNIAVARNGLGSMYSQLGQIDTALAQYELALAAHQKTGSQANIALALNNMGVVYLGLGRRDQALNYMERSLAIYQKIGDQRWTAILLDNIGELYAHLGRYQEALQNHERALAVAQRVGSPADLAICILHLGGVCICLGRFDAALDHYERGLGMAEKLGHPKYVAGALTGLGNANHALGRYGEALKHHDRAVKIAGQHGTSMEMATYLGNRAIVNGILGRYEAALEDNERALEICEKVGNRQFAAQVRNNLGTVCDFLGRHEEALKHHLRVLAFREESGHPEEVAMSLSNLGKACTALDRLDEAVKYHRRGVAILEKTANRQHLAIALNNLGALYERLGRYDEAVDHVARSVAIQEKGGEPGRLADFLFNFSLLQRLRGRYGEARERLARALDKLSRARREVAADRERIAYAETWQDRLLPALETALGDDAHEPDPALALRTLESLRGAATADLFQVSLAAIRPTAKPELVADARRIARAIENLQKKLSKSVAAPPGSPAAVRAADARKRMRKEQGGLEGNWQDAMSRIARQSPEYAALRRPEAVSLHNLKRLLPRRSAYLAYALGKERSLLLVVDHDGLRHYPLPPRGAIVQALGGYLSRIRRRPGDGEADKIRSAGQKLHSVLLGPLEKDETLNRYSTLLISPEGPLYGLPFETLIRAADTPLAAAPFLVKSHTIFYVHSATVWSQHLQRIAQRRTAVAKSGANRSVGALVLADALAPDETADAASMAVYVDARERAGFKRLTHSRTEALRIADAFVGAGGIERVLAETEWSLRVEGETVAKEDQSSALQHIRDGAAAARSAWLKGPALDLRLGSHASRDALLAETVAGYRFVHLAAHGHVHRTSPGLSGIVLSPADGSSGYLRLMDVMNLRLGAELVVLSGCETQLGKATLGEGYQGLMRAFLYAGSANVIASSWRVPDEATARLLPAVYRALLHENLGPAAALRRAQLEYVASVDPAAVSAASPYYWGAWTVWGTGIEAGPR